MREMITSELMLAMQELTRTIAHVLPRLVVLLIVALIGWAVASLLRALLRSLLRLIRFDALSENAGATQLLHRVALPSATELLSSLIFWLAWLGFILVGISVLGIFGFQELIGKFFLFLPRLFAGLFIMFFGLVGANFVSRAALLGAVNDNMPSPRLMSAFVRILLSILALSMGFEELGIADQTVLLAFGITFGACMLGLAIAFGLGGKEMANQFLEQRLRRSRSLEEQDDELSPL